MRKRETPSAEDLRLLNLELKYRDKAEKTPFGGNKGGTDSAADEVIDEVILVSLINPSFKHVLIPLMRSHCNWGCIGYERAERLEEETEEGSASLL